MLVHHCLIDLMTGLLPVSHQLDVGFDVWTSFFNWVFSAPASANTFRWLLSAQYPHKLDMSKKNFVEEATLYATVTVGLRLRHSMAPIDGKLPPQRPRRSSNDAFSE